MRFSTALRLSATAFSALVHAAPAPVAEEPFTSPGTVDGGFKIPEGTASGIYVTTLDDSGVAHHRKLGEIPADLGTFPGLEEGAANETLARRALEKRQWTSCPGGFPLNHDWANGVAAAMYGYCGGGWSVGPYEHFWAMIGNVAAFDCNHGDAILYCSADFYRQNFVEIIPYWCGHWMSGWVDYEAPRRSIGMHTVTWNADFCGRPHV